MMLKKSPKRSLDEIEEERLHFSIEHKGVTYTKGDPVGIRGEQGQFFFQRWDETPTGKTTITVWWVGRHWRHFYIEKLRPPKKTKSNIYRLCDDHPTYGAIRRPRGDCTTCWSAYEAKHGTETVKTPKAKKVKPKLQKAEGMILESEDD